MNKVQQLFDESSSPAQFANHYLEYLKSVLTQLDPEQIAKLIETLQIARRDSKMVFFLGNGGSAATASHFVNDLSIGTRSWKRPFRAMSLTDNVAGMTAIANDYGYEEIFVIQLKAHLQAGDVVVAISASGNSPNLLKAVEYAHSRGALTVGLTGFDGGRLKGLAKLSVHVPTGPGEYGPVEDAHMVLDHLVCAYLTYSVTQENEA